MMRKILDWFATCPRGSFAERRTRLLGALALTLAFCGPVLAGDTSGPLPPGQPNNRAPVCVGGTVQPSPQTSPGVVQHVAVTSEGRVQVALPAASPVPIALPASSPVVVTGPLPSGSPVGALASLPVVSVSTASSTAQGLSTYCDPAFAGGSSEVTVSPSPCNLYTYSISNPNTSDVYWETWDATNPTPGTTAPKTCILVPAGLGASNRGWRDADLATPITYSTALTHTIVTVANGSATPTNTCTVTLGVK